MFWQIFGMWRNFSPSWMNDANWIWVAFEICSVCGWHNILVWQIHSFQRFDNLKLQKPPEVFLWRWLKLYDLGKKKQGNIGSQQVPHRPLTFVVFEVFWVVFLVRKEQKYVKNKGVLGDEPAFMLCDDPKVADHLNGELTGPFTPRSSFVSREDLTRRFLRPFPDWRPKTWWTPDEPHRRQGSNCLWHHSSKSHKWTLKTLWELIYRPNLSTAKRAEDFRPVAETRFAKVHFGKWWKPTGLTGASVSRYDQVLDQSFGCHGVYGCVPFLPALQGFLVHHHAEWAEVNDECEVVVREEVDLAPQLLKLKKHPTKISNLNSPVGFRPCEKKART